MAMGLVDVEQPDLFLTDLVKDRLERLNEGGVLRQVGFAEHRLAFSPTQTVRVEELTQGLTADLTPEDLLDPTTQLLPRPVVPR
jgi:hypothetical protein